MKFPYDRFQQFCSRLVIDSKEEGQIKLGFANQLGTQQYVIEQMIKGLEEDCHYFVCLKGRQLGITTITLALDLFWHWNFPGMQGTLAADCDENRDMFRDTLTTYYNGLPRAFRVRMLRANRNFMSFANRSRIMMQIGGGAKKKGQKGRGKGLTFMHATEVSSWDDEESLASILASLAEHNPLRLYLFETTARGFNMFHDIWETAKRATTQRAIFCGWWRNQFYRCKQGTPAYNVYWDGKLTPQEREWVRAIKLMYGYDIDAEQMAWWRWKLAETIRDENMMMQEYPPHEELAFILTGKNFFSAPKLQELNTVIKAEDQPTHYKVTYGQSFEDTEVEETIEALSELKVWEAPDDDGVYSIGADPAYGSSDWADRFAIEVYRCYADRCEQVAEFCTPDMNTYRFAWVLCYLAGLYRRSMVNLEINGPGQAVFAEMQALRVRAATVTASEDTGIKNFLAHLRYYLYRKLDSIGGGVVYHFKTTTDTKERALNQFRDGVDRRETVLHSTELVDEMKIVVREDGFLGATGRGKDDRVMASALAIVQYNDHLKYRLIQEKRTYQLALQKRERMEREARDGVKLDEAASNALTRSVGDFLNKVGIQNGRR